MRRECRENFPNQGQWKAIVSDPSMHHGRCMTHVPWCMSKSLTCGGGENVPGIPSACAKLNFTYLVRGPWRLLCSMPTYKVLPFCGIGCTYRRSACIAFSPDRDLVRVWLVLHEVSVVCELWLGVRYLVSLCMNRLVPKKRRHYFVTTSITGWAQA